MDNSFCYNALRLDVFIEDSWQSLVECTGLENRQGVKPLGGSNPSLSATFSLFKGSLVDPFFMFWTEFGPNFNDRF